jgi:Putative prokaryotic signal transducing protein
MFLTRDVAMASEHPEPPRMVVVSTGGSDVEAHAIANFLTSNGIAARVPPTSPPSEPGTQLLPSFQPQVLVPEAQAEQARRLLEKPFRHQGERRSAKRSAGRWGDAETFGAVIWLSMLLFGLLAAIAALFTFGR